MPLPLGGPKQRAVLALLLAYSRETVPVSRLIDELWHDPPASAANVVQGYVSALRKVLGKDTIVTRGAAYALQIGGGSLDLQQFERQAADGAEALERGRAREAASCFAAALRLWRGPALSDLDEEPFAAPIARRLDELRLVVLERRLEAELACGRSAEVAAELETLTAQHPLRERLIALRMLALYRNGRQTEALEVYRRARSSMVQEAGIEPGPALQELERAILRQDAALGADGGQAARRGELPARAVLLAALDLAAVDLLLTVAAPLAAHAGRELVLAHTVSDARELAAATALLHDRRTALLEQGIEARAAAFTSLTPGMDVSRLALEQDVDLLVVDAPQLLLEDARLLAVLADAPCDVAIHVGGGARPGTVLVPFSGAEHDWAAVELGAWLAAAWSTPLRLAGSSSGADGRDASRLLASASLAVQRTLGIAAEPLLVEPEPGALVQAAAGAGVVAIGLSRRWRQSGLGPTRTAVATAGAAPTLLVRRGLRPGGLAPRGTDTRFTWTLLPAGG